MAKGIVKIINTYNGTEIAVLPCEDIESMREKIKNGELPIRLERYPYKENLKLEVLEETDNLAERYAYYTWPQNEKISYSYRSMAVSLEKGMGNKMKHSVAWLCNTFNDTKYSFEMDVEEGKIIGIVSVDGQRSEKYVFSKKSGEPSIRKIFE